LQGAIFAGQLRPLSFLPLVANLIDGALTDTGKHIETLTRVRCNMKLFCLLRNARHQLPAVAY
jgi:hypothetical protein